MRKSLWLLIAFLLIQAMTGIILGKFAEDLHLSDLSLIISTSALSNGIILAITWKSKWVRNCREYICSRQWKPMAWAAVLALGIILPLVAIEELIPRQWRFNVIPLWVLKGMFNSPLSFLVICLLAPLAEEVIFRHIMISTIVRRINKRRALLGKVSTLTGYSNPQARWVAIITSSIFFCIAHLNPAQAPHTILMGIVLGWVYAETRSMVPCVIIHCINNSAAFAICHLFPSVPVDADMIDYFGGNFTLYCCVIVLSTAIALVGLYQFAKSVRASRVSA